MEKLAQAGTVIIAAVILCAALIAGSAILAPVCLALVVGVVLSPLSDLWERLRLPPTIGALISLILTIVFLGLLGLVFQPLVVQLVEQAPKVWSDLHDVIEVLRRFLRGLSDVSKEIASAAAPAANAESLVPADPGVSLPPITEALLLVPSIAGQSLVFVGSLFFFLMTRNEIYGWAAHRLSSRVNRAVTTRRLREADLHVARYFMAISAVNAGLGLATAAGLAIIGLPGAALWGVIAFVMNFVVYLGPMLVNIGLLFAGVAAFDGGMGFAPLAIFLGLNAIEGQFVTPTLLGRTMAVNPLVVFLAIVFGLWLWGPIGGIVAIPALLWVLVLADQLQRPAAEEKVREKVRD